MAEGGMKQGTEPPDEGRPSESESLQDQALPDTASELTDMDVAAFQAVTDHFKQDLRELYTRHSLFMAVQAALLSAEFFKSVGLGSDHAKWLKTSVGLGSDHAKWLKTC